MLLAAILTILLLAVNKSEARSVGQRCRYNTDCNSGMFCPGGICACLSNFVQYNQNCYQKIDPGQAGCQYTEQCSAVWQGARCESGQCKCPEGTPRAEQTPDGFVCVRADPNLASCPLPVADDTDAMLVSATGDFEICTVGGACASAGVNVGELYDCIPLSAGAVAGICCPNRAYTCMLPLANQAGGVETRWYFNSASGACVQFSYSRPIGGANANNFRSREQCESYCLAGCRRGTPQYTTATRLDQRTIQTCSGGSSSCSGGSFTCKTTGSGSRCCPSTTSICTAPLNLGLAAVVSTRITIPARTRYYYDNGKCTPFQWTGQGGNFNNFESAPACQSFCSTMLCEQGEPIKDASGGNLGCGTCPGSHECRNGVCCPTKQTVCNQKPEVGGCQEPSTRYHYDAALGSCRSFQYSGCQGNANRFRDPQECQSYCSGMKASVSCTQGVAAKDYQGNFIQCSGIGGIGRCPAGHECQYDGRAYGCCPTRRLTCTEPVNNGINCGPRSNRWYFDTSKASCESFTYEGCNGNSNNFPSREACQQHCGGGGVGGLAGSGGYCPRGVAFGVGVPQDCTHNIYSCPGGLTCIYNSALRRNYCCATTGTGVIAGQQSRLACIGPCNIGCRHPYTCTMYNGVYQCCASNTLGSISQQFGNPFLGGQDRIIPQCPRDTTAYPYPYNGRPLACPNRDECPLGYFCRQGTTGEWICCGNPTAAAQFRGALTSAAQRARNRVANQRLWQRRRS